jgi:hypothetical protein
MRILFFALGILAFNFKLFSQTTFDRVYQILQTNCTGYCHNSGNPTGNLLMDGTKQDVLNNLVNVTPDNTTAASNGYKRVKPGDARKSFLFHKVNQGLDPNISLQSGEGNAMPDGQHAISQVEREMIRQWIIFGAQDSLYPYADENVITQYYNGFAEQRETPLPVPNPGIGYQIYYGPVFLMPGEEVEFDMKAFLYNNADLEVHKMNVLMNKESHHMAIFKYHSNNDTLFPDGLKKVNSLLDAAGLFYAADVVAQWPNSLEIELPAGTALFWDSNTVLSISYHILNYSDSIITAEAHMNVFTRPRNVNTIEMTSYPVRYDGHPQYQGGWDVANLIIPPTNGGDTTLSINQWHADSTHYWNIWSIQAHSHKYGKDYDVWLRNSDGSKGCQVYNGSYDVTHTFDTGIYDWEHPPLRYFDPPLAVDMTKGMIHESTYQNNTPNPIYFGLTTEDEMFVTYIFYYKSQNPIGTFDPCPLVGIGNLNNSYVKLFPNPTTGVTVVNIHPDIELNNASIKIYNILGEEIYSENNISKLSTYFDLGQAAGGQYFYRLTNNGALISSGKIVKE